MSKIQPLGIIATLLSCLILIAGCSREKDSKTPVQDGIVSLAPSITELLFALNLEQRIVGVTTACDFPEAAKSLPQVGSFMNINREAVLASGATWVIGVSGGLPDSEVAKLESSGIRVLLLKSGTISETMEAITQLGSSLQIEAKASAFRTALEASLKPSPAQKIGVRPTGIIVLSTKPLMVAGPNTFVGELLELAGLENAVGTSPVDYPSWDKEALLKANPDWIIYAMMKGDVPSKKNEVWAPLPAVIEGRTRSIHPDVLLRPGPRMAEGVKLIREAVSQMGGEQE